MEKIKLYLVLLLGLLLCSAPAMAAILVDAGDVMGLSGNINVPVNISGIPTAGIDAFGFELDFGANSLTFNTVTSPNLGGTLLGNVVSPGVLRIGWFAYPAYTNATASLSIIFTIKTPCEECNLIVDETSFTGDFAGATKSDGYFSCNEGCSVTVSPTSGTIALPGSLQLTATCTGDTCTDTFVWTSSNTSVATVNSSGLVTGVAGGNCTITVYDVGCGAGETATCAITVGVGCVITVSPPSVTVAVGATTPLVATCSGADCDNNFLWGSDNTAVATVNQNTGVVTGVSVGEATIGAADTGCGQQYYDTCVVTVTNVCDITGIDPQGTQTIPYELELYTTVTFTASVEGSCTNTMWVGLETTLPPTQTDNITWQNLGNHQCDVTGAVLGPCAIVYVDLDDPQNNNTYSIINVVPGVCNVAITPTTWAALPTQTTTFAGTNSGCTGPFAWSTNPPNSPVVNLVDNGDDTATATAQQPGTCEVCYGSQADQKYACATVTVYMPYKYLIMTGYGSVHGVLPNGEVVRVLYRPWEQDFARDLELDPKSPTGFYILDLYGGVHGYKGAALGNPYYEFGWYPNDTARALQILPTGNGYYILTKLGSVHPMGAAPAGNTRIWEFDIARDLELNPAALP